MVIAGSGAQQKGNMRCKIDLSRVQHLIATSQAGTQAGSEAWCTHAEAAIPEQILRFAWAAAGPHAGKQRLNTCKTPKAHRVIVAIG